MSKYMMSATIDLAEHFTPEHREAIVAAYLPHEREARARGNPVLGSGRVFQIEDARISVEPFPIPAHWPQLNGLDFGWDHPFAAVNCAWDRDSEQDTADIKLKLDAIIEEQLRAARSPPAR